MVSWIIIVTLRLLLQILLVTSYFPRIPTGLFTSLLVLVEASMPLKMCIFVPRTNYRYAAARQPYRHVLIDKNSDKAPIWPRGGMRSIFGANIYIRTCDNNAMVELGVSELVSSHRSSRNACTN